MVGSPTYLPSMGTRAELSPPTGVELNLRRMLAMRIQPWRRVCRSKDGGQKQPRRPSAVQNAPELGHQLLRAKNPSGAGLNLRRMLYVRIQPWRLFADSAYTGPIF